MHVHDDSLIAPSELSVTDSNGVRHGLTDGQELSDAGARARWRNLEIVLHRHHHQPDIEAARVLYSSIAAHRLKGPPVWQMIVAPPGSSKTELLSGLEGLPKIHHIDQMTPRSFISGQIDDTNQHQHGNAMLDSNGGRPQSSSLLHRIGNDGIIIYPDFSTVLSMRAEDKASVLADLRRIYDGSIRKEYGTACKLDDRKWEGRLTIAVACTPDLDRQYSVFQTLGERFIIVRLRRPGGVEAALRAMDQDRETATRDIREAVHAIFYGWSDYDPILPSDSFKHRIACIAEFAVQARTHVARDGYKKEIVYVPEPEAATRLAQQLAQLCKGSALIGGRHEANEADYSVVKRAAFDSIPAHKRAVLDEAIHGPAKAANLPGSTESYARGDLEAQGLLTDRKLSALARELLVGAGVLQE